MTPRGVLFCSIFAYLLSADAYELDTHARLSLAAAKSSMLADPIARARIGLARPISDRSQKFIGSHAGKLTLEELITNGARYEDDFPRSLHHFFDPTNDTALFLGANEFQGADQADLDLVNVNAVASPDWALGTGCSSDFGCNSYSLKSARDYFFKGLTTLNRVDREGYLGLTFDSLGRIIHHLQDMAQPQHVRNDAHLHIEGLGIDLFCTVFNTIDECRTWNALVRPSVYERWTNQLSVLSTIPTSGYDPVYASTDAGADGLSVFGGPRLFWKNAGKGIAEFTARNFLSENTMHRRPPLVDFATGVDVDAVTLCTTAAPPCAAPVSPGDVVTFYSSVADDQFRPAQIQLNHAAAMSIFDVELTQRNPGQPRYTVNRFTFADDHSLLLPRAVAYSAGFINYFFRGDMKIELPDEGVYAIADQSPNGCGTPCGFTKIKVKLTNVTPGIVGGQVTAGGEAMGAGTLRAVVKHHLNTCYQTDLSGEYGGAAFAGDACRSKDEFILVSAPYTVQSVSAVEPQTITFDFGATPIPINASDVYLQVVFRGKLGMEDDAVAVSTTDTAESNFFAFANMSDYAYDTLDQKYHPLSPNASPLDMTSIRLQFDGGAGKPLATLPVLPGGGHAQLAYLTNKGSAGLYIQYEFPDAADSPFVFTELVNEFTADNDTGPYTRTCPVKKLRGLYRDDMFFVWQYVHGVVSWRQLKGAVGDDAPSAATIQGSRLRSKAASGGADCVPQGDMVGVKDFSIMTPQTVSTASTWNISFP